MTIEAARPKTRGTTNGNQRGSSTDRRARRSFIVLTYQSNIPGFCRCYRCGVLLYNPDDYLDSAEGDVWARQGQSIFPAFPLTVDRIIPGCKGGTYRRSNIRPACGGCNSETGGALAGPRRKK